MLDKIVQPYAMSHVFTSRLTALESIIRVSKYPSVSGISDMLLSKKAGCIVVSCRKVCFSGNYVTLRNYKYRLEQQLPDYSSYDPVPLSSDKARQLVQQHSRYIKHDVPNYNTPTFLKQSTEPTAPTGSARNQKRKCTYPGCDGSGHVKAGRKRHLSVNNCPKAAKKPHLN